MKVLFPSGSVAVVYKNRRTLTNSQLKLTHSFGPHYSEIAVFVNEAGHIYVTFVTELKDGSTHGYFYGPYTDIGSAQAARHTCNGEHYFGNSGDYGGVFYNPAVRPLLVSKDDYPS